jgi:2-polyprenyl-6-methoxyphenol hydroxylase-like FAD-dependent oxidoreductase
MKARKIDSQVLVVGAGPVGLALAAELEMAGVHAVVVEQLAQPDNARHSHWSEPSIDTLRQCCVDPMSW